MQVSEQQYLDRRLCWNENAGKIEGFLVIRRNSSGDYFPSLISAYCYTEHDFSVVEGIQFRVTGDGGALMRRGIIDRTLSGNIVTEQMPGSSFVRIIAFRASLRPVHQVAGSPRAFALDNFDFAVDSGISEEDLIGLGPIGRWRHFLQVVPD
jgi:hypothetical protein